MFSLQFLLTKEPCWMSSFMIIFRDFNQLLLGLFSVVLTAALTKKQSAKINNPTTKNAE